MMEVRENEGNCASEIDGLMERERLRKGEWECLSHAALSTTISGRHVRPYPLQFIYRVVPWDTRVGLALSLSPFYRIKM